MKRIKKYPVFKSEDEERKWLADKEVTDIFDPKSGTIVVFSNLKPSTKTVTIRVSESMLANLRSIANKKDVPYQSLAKMYLDEKIREEYGMA